MTLTLPKPFKYATALDGRALDLVISDAYCMQQKIDGRRLIIVKTEHGISCYNKRYETSVAAPTWLYEALDKLPGAPWGFDGELTDDGHYHVFDLTNAPNSKSIGIKMDLTQRPFDERQLLLQVVSKNWKHDNLHRLETHYNSQDKFMHLLDLRKSGAEGVVFRPRDSIDHFTGQVYKYKFYQSVDAIVTNLRVGGKQAITVGVFHNNEVRDIGNAKVDFETQDKLKVHTSVVEIRHRGLGSSIETGGRMIEPVFLRVRHDKPAYLCDSDQLTIRGQALGRGKQDLSDVHAFDACRKVIGLERHEAIQLIKGERIND